MPLPTADRISAVVFALLAFAAARAEAADAVAVRAADHGDFGRIVFDWNVPVGHSVGIDGRQLTVTFDKPMEGSFDSVLHALKGYVSAARLENGGRKAVFALTGDFTASDFESGPSLAVDLRRASAADADGGKRRIAVRAGDHDGFSRIVFDWPGLIDYKASESGHALTLIFPQSAALDLEAVKRDLPPFVTGIEAAPEGAGLKVTIAGVDAARFRHFRSETKLVVDVLPPAAVAEHALLPAEGPAANPAAPVPPPPGGSTNAPQPAPTDAKPPAPTLRRRVMVADVADPATEQGAKDPVSLLPEKQAASSPAPDRALDGGLKPAAATPPAAQPAAPAPPVNAAAAASAPEKSAGPMVIATPGAPERAAPSMPSTAQMPQLPAATQAAQPKSDMPAQAVPQTDARPVAVAAKAEKSALVINFGWKDPVGAAVFRRAGALWVVFDRKAPLDLSELENWRKEVAAAEIPVVGATVLRLSTGPAMSASVRREGTGVSIVLSRNPARLANAIAPAPAGESNPRLLLPLADARNPVSVPDAEVGDTLVVVPVMVAGEGVAAERQYALFRLLATASGVVVEPKADGVTVKTLSDGVEISSPSGLFLSTKNGALPTADPAVGGTPPADLPAPAKAASQDSAAVAPPAPAMPADGSTISPSGAPAAEPELFDFAAWGRGDAPYDDTRTALLRAVVTAPDRNRNAVRLDLARFYFARGQYADALGVLGVIAANDPAAVESASFLSLRGACSYLMDDYAQAADDLGSAALATYPDAQLWRGAVAASQAHWADAVPAFARVGDRIQDYPAPLKVKFGLLAAETAINSHEFPAAQTYLDFVTGTGPDSVGQARVKYLLGMLAAVRRETDKAAALYDEATANGDPATQAKAKFAKVAMLLDAKKIADKKAIDILEELRFAWRGDSMELEVLRKLGDLYLVSGEYEKGLTTLKRAVTLFPDDPRAKEAAEEMSAAFAKLYVDGAADSLPPLKSLGIYQEFRELTPPGAAGDTVIRNLAERMVAVDLLSEAGDLLEPLVSSRLQGADKLAAGTRLAVIRLLDKKPEKALEALKAGAIADVATELAAERRRIEARALADEGKAKEALAALDGDNGRDADLLRSDILWRMRNWAEAAKVLGRLTEQPEGKTEGEGPALNDQTAQLVLKRAAALWLAGDEEALANLRDRFAEPMAKTSYRDDFRVIAAAEAGEADSVEAVTARIADVDAYAAFAADLKGGPKPAAKDGAERTAAASANPKELAAKTP